MNVVAVNGSVRREGNTALLIDAVLRPLEEEGIKTTHVKLGAEPLPGCVACYQCFERKDGKCATKGDRVNDMIALMQAANGIILGSPTYFADVSANMKALIERVGMVSRANNNMLRRKVGAGVVAVRRGGAIHTFNSLNHFFLIGEMIVVGSIYWNLAIGRNPGEVLQDEEGMKTMMSLGQNMAWLLKQLNT